MLIAYNVVRRNVELTPLALRAFFKRNDFIDYKLRASTKV